MRKIILLSLIITVFFASSIPAFGISNDIIGDAIDKIPTDSLEEYVNENDDFFSSNNIDITSLIKNAFTGRLDIDIKEYILYQIKREQNFFNEIIMTCVNVLTISMLLTIINYFTEDSKSQNVSEIVVFFSALIIFTIVMKDVINIKTLLKSDFTKFKTVTQEINAVFLAAMLTFGKLSLLQFFQSSLNYIVGLTTSLIYGFTDIMTVIMVSVILVNNASKILNAKILYKFLKKGTLLILSGYIFIVVLNFSVQGYILYKTDNIFISSIKALSPSSIPVVGNAVTSFFGVFLKSILMIKDVLGIVVIIFLLTAFGGSLIKIFFIFIMYKATSAVLEPMNENISKLVFEMADIFYVYLICLLTPIIIETVYYSVLLNYMNNIFG